MATKSEPCPKCRENGKDTRGNNLQRWHDGHAHCFACEYHEWNTVGTVGKLSNQQERAWIAAHSGESEIALPKDASSEIDYMALTWLAAYDIEAKEVTKYKMLWSKSKQMLIFPFYADEYEPHHPTGKLMGWQGRCFNPNALQKYYKVGGFFDYYHVLNISDGKGNDLIVVEDFISAIKIARKYTSMALLGSTLSTAKMKGLMEFTQHLTFWLDEDKAEKAYLMANTARMLNFSSKFIITKHDPKEYNNAQIQNFIETDTHHHKDPRLV